MISFFIKFQNAISRLYYSLWNKIKFLSYGKNIILSKGVKHFHLLGKIYLRIKKNGQIIIGDFLTISSGSCYNPISRNIRTTLFVEKGACIEIGENVGISSACIWAHEYIYIGNNVKIGADTIVVDSDCHSLNYLSRCGSDDQKTKKNVPIIINNDVLIGARCIVLKGVTIGARSVIGAGSIVTGSIPPDCIAAGNPCQVIKFFNHR